MTSSSSSARPTRADAGALSARSERPARALILGALAYASALLFGWNCPIKYLTGVPCPGCGLSRALAALLRLDFRTALRFHPMVFVLPPVVLYALFGKKPLFGSKNLERVLLWSVIVLDIAIWLIRLALHDPLIF